MALDRWGGWKKPLPWLIVDGYNIIGAWEELRSLSLEDLSAARDRLAYQLLDYCGHSGQSLLLVFDAHSGQSGERVERLAEEGEHRLVYTKKGQTADQYIERFVRDTEGELCVASSDGLVQVMIGSYAVRLSALDLYKAVQREKDVRDRRYAEQNWQKRGLSHRLSDDAASALEKLRQGLDRGEEKAQQEKSGDAEKRETQLYEASSPKNTETEETPKKKRRRPRRRKPLMAPEGKKAKTEHTASEGPKLKPARQDKNIESISASKNENGKTDGGKRRKRKPGNNDPARRER